MTSSVHCYQAELGTRVEEWIRSLGSQALSPTVLSTVRPGRPAWEAEAAESSQDCFGSNLGLLGGIHWKLRPNFKCALNFRKVSWNVSILLFKELTVGIQIFYSLLVHYSLVALTLKNLSAMQQTWVWFLDLEDPLEKDWKPTPIFLPGEFHGQGSLVGCSPWGHKELNATEWLSLSFFIGINTINITFSWNPGRFYFLGLL